MYTILTEIYFKTLGLALNFVGGAILIVGTVKSNRQIKDETTIVPLKKSLVVKKSLFKTRSISLIGFALVSIGFLLQLIGIAFEIY